MPLTLAIFQGAVAISSVTHAIDVLSICPSGSKFAKTVAVAFFIWPIVIQLDQKGLLLTRQTDAVKLPAVASKLL